MLRVLENASTFVSSGVAYLFDLYAATVKYMV